MAHPDAPLLGTTILPEAPRGRVTGLPSPHLGRMPLAVKQDEPAHPLHVLRLRANAVMLDTNSVTGKINGV